MYTNVKPLWHWFNVHYVLCIYVPINDCIFQKLKIAATKGTNDIKGLIRRCSENTLYTLHIHFNVGSLIKLRQCGLQLSPEKSKTNEITEWKVDTGNFWKDVIQCLAAVANQLHGCSDLR